MAFEASAIVDSASEASSVNTDVVSLDMGGQEGSLVPADFRPFGSEDDLLCTWQMSMLRTEGDAAILGRGSFGSVEEVKTANGHSLAMKTVVVKPGSQQWVRTEVDLLQECSAHPHVVDLHGFITTNERVYLVMSKADTTLLSLTQSGAAVDDVRAAQFTRQLVSAVEFLHHRMIIHRDIKPANILLRNGEVLLADFGVSTRTESGLSPQTDGCGTEMYLPPEVLMGMPHGLAVDMWATGVVTYELLHGTHPFWHGDEQADQIPSGSLIDVGGDAGRVFQVGDEGGVGGGGGSGGGAHSSGTGVGSAGVRAVAEGSLPPLPPSVSTGHYTAGVVGTFSENTRNAQLNVAGDLRRVGGRGGGGAHSSGTGVGSAGVRAVAEGSLPLLPPSVSAGHANARIVGTYPDNLKQAQFNVREDLDSDAKDFIHKLLQRNSSQRMTAAKAAEHKWLNRNPEDSALRSDLRARTMDAMAAKRALRLDAAVFKAEQAAHTMEKLQDQVLDSSALEEQSSANLPAGVMEATEDILSCLFDYAKRVTSMKSQTHEAHESVKLSEKAIAEGETGVPSGVQVGGGGGGTLHWIVCRTHGGPVCVESGDVRQGSRGPFHSGGGGGGSLGGDVGRDRGRGPGGG